MRKNTFSICARPLNSLGLLYDGQKDCAHNVLKDIARRAEELQDMRGEPGSDERPHQVFVFDGQRGAGKTTLLLTLRRFLECLGREGRHGPPSLSDLPTDVGCKIFEELKDLVDDEHSPAKTTRPRPSEERKPLPVMLCLPPVFPEHFEKDESVMEALLAHIEDFLVRSKKNAQTGDGRRQNDHWDKLIKQLRHEVYAGWAFSRHHGMEALLRDAMDYKDYIGLRAEFNRVSTTRLTSWHRFVDSLLDDLDIPLLGVFFDDTDLAPQHGWQIFDTVRTYLSHPRIVSFLALDFRMWQSRLERQAVEKIRPFVTEMRQIDPGLATEHVELERKDARAHLAKALPVSQRYAFGLRGMGDIDLIWGDGDGGFIARCLERAEIAMSGSAPRSESLAWWLLGYGKYPWLPFQSVRWALEFREKFHADGDSGIAGFLLQHWEAPTLHRMMEEATQVTFKQAKDKIRAEFNTKQFSRGESNTLLYRGSRNTLTDYEVRLLGYILDVHLAESRLAKSAVESLRYTLPAITPLRSGEHRDLLPNGNAILGMVAYYGEGHCLPRNLLYLADMEYLPTLEYAYPSLDTLWFAPGNDAGFWKDTGFVLDDKDWGRQIDRLCSLKADPFAQLRAGIDNFRSIPNQRKNPEGISLQLRGNGAIALMLTGLLIGGASEEKDFLFPLAERLLKAGSPDIPSATHEWDWERFHLRIYQQQQVAHYCRELLRRASVIAASNDDNLGVFDALSGSDISLSLESGRMLGQQLRSSPPHTPLARRSHYLLAWAALPALPVLILDSLLPGNRKNDIAHWGNILEEWNEILSCVESAQFPIETLREQWAAFPDLDDANLKAIDRQFDNGLDAARNLVSDLQSRLNSTEDATSETAKLALASGITRISFGWMVDLAEYLAKA